MTATGHPRSHAAHQGHDLAVHGEGMPGEIAAWAGNDNPRHGGISGIAMSHRSVLTAVLMIGRGFKNRAVSLNTKGPLSPRYGGKGA